MIAPVLLFAATLAYIYYLSQKDTADAPGHCGECTVTTGQKFSFDELLSLAQDAGFDANSQTAAAIAMAESGGDPNAYNPERQAGAPEGEGSYGLWQIYHNKHKEFTPEQLKDPATNAQEAYKVYADAGGFSPWSTFKSGAYQKYLPPSCCTA